MKKGWVVLGLVAVVAVAVGGGLVSGAIKPPGALALARGAAADGQKPEVPLEFLPREVVQPSRSRLPAVVAFSGPLVAPQTAVVRAKAGGTLVALGVAEGSRVAAGQVLGRIDVAEVTSRVAERNALVESARAALVQAERTHLSNERLAQQNFISPMALDNSRAALETARANLSAATASLETTRVGLRDAVLVAPIAGIVARRHALPGEKVSVEQQVLTLVDIARLELAGSVGTHDVGRLKPGMPAEVQVEGVPEPAQGRIARIAPAAEPGTRSIGVTIELANPRETFRAGQYAMARTVLDDATERLTLPEAAVGSTGGQEHVWLIENGLLARRAVTLGRRDERAGRVEVLAGVSPSSVVLAARFDNLREGAKAGVVASRGAPVASASASTPVRR